MATLGELNFGHGRTAPTLVCFTLGTGIGGGVAVDGTLRRGPLGAAGEIGHQTIVPDGPLCTCGNRGCLEALASPGRLACSAFAAVRSRRSFSSHASSVSRFT
jgi:glucokinase